MDSNCVAKQAREDKVPGEVAHEELEKAAHDVDLHPKSTTSNEESILAIPYDMDARDETALIDAYERAVGTCKLDKSTTAASEEERRVPHKDTAGPQQRLSVHRCPQPCSEPSPEQEQHEEQVLESDGIGSSQPEENESDGTDDGNFVPIEYDVDAWDDTELVAAYERAMEMGGNTNRAKKNRQRKRKRQDSENTHEHQSLDNDVHRGLQPFTTPLAREQGGTECGAERTLSCVPVPSEIMLPKLVPTHDWMTAIPEDVEPIRAAKRVRFSMDYGETPASEVVPMREPSTASPTHVSDSMIPPPPPAILARQRLSPELEELLNSWYIAGYRAGLAASTQTTE